MTIALKHLIDVNQNLLPFYVQHNNKRICLGRISACRINNQQFRLSSDWVTLP